MQIKNLAIGIGIIVMTAFVIIYGINTFYARPEYSDFCNDVQPVTINDAVSCEAVGGKWVLYDSKTEIAENSQTGWCDREWSCRDEYDTASESYWKVVFIIATIAGLLVIGLGMVLFNLESVGAGLMGGGIVSIIYGAGGYWEYSSDAIRFVLSIIGLGILIYLAYWFNSSKSKKRKFLKNFFK